MARAALAMIVLYALTSFIGGFVGARLYRQFDGLNWVWNTVLTALVFPAPLMCIFMWVNTVAWSRGSSAALPWHTVMIIAALYALVSFPLTVIGAIAGRNLSTGFEAPCRTTGACETSASSLRACARDDAVRAGACKHFRGVPRCILLAKCWRQARRAARAVGGNVRTEFF